MISFSELLNNIFKQILSVVAAFYLLFGIKMDFSWARAKKNFNERKELFKSTAGQVAAMIFFLLILFFHFYVPGVSLLSAVAVSFLFSSLAYIFVVGIVLLTEPFFLSARFSGPPYSTSYFISDTTFKPVFIPVPTAPPRFKLAAKSTKF